MAYLPRMRRLAMTMMALWALTGSGQLNVEINADLCARFGVAPAGGLFPVTTQDLAFASQDLEWLAGGAIEAAPWRLVARPGTRQFDAWHGGDHYVLDNPHTGQHRDRLHLLNLDLRLSPDLADTLGQPTWAGLSVGTVHVALDWPDILHPRLFGTSPCPTNFGPNLDVALIALDQMQQMAREPGGRVALTFATRLKNIGQHDVPWFWSILPPGNQMPVLGQHPYLILNLYRLADGRLEQIARSDAKHAFYSTNEDCPCAGAQVIFSGCADTYGANNNAQQFFFAPREEITAHSGSWTSLGSHFDGVPVDNIRHHSNHVDNFTHRLVAAEPDLQTSNAQYVAEAWYVVQGDTNIFNTMGHRAITPSYDGTGLWTFAFTGSLVTGPALRAWNAQTSAVIASAYGHLEWAAAVTNLGTGWWRYDLALMNHDYDRQVQSLFIPLTPGLAVTNPSARDGDAAVSNDWTATLTSTGLLWQAPAGAALDWGRLLSFRFQAAAPSAPASGWLAALEPGSDPGVAATLPLPRTTSPQAVIAAGAGATIAWTPQSNALYQVQASTDLATAAWFDVGGPVTGDAPALSVLDTNATDPHRSYRILLRGFLP